MFNNIPFFFRKLRLLLDNVGKCCTARQATDDDMAYAHCMPTATNTHSEYVILIAFPLQQW